MRANILAAADDSLRRLKTDFIDVYCAHQDDASVPMEETLGAVAAELDATPAAVALVWLRAQPTVAVPIASARTVEQLAPLLDVVNLSHTQLALLN